MIPILEIVRLEEYSRGTLGILRVQKIVQMWTLEPADFLNQQRISSIPAQQYEVVRWQSPHFGETFMVKDVPGRTNILFHTGNTIQDTEGCIILGSGLLGNEQGVSESRKAFDRFMRLLEGYDKAHLTIMERY